MRKSKKERIDRFSGHLIFYPENDSYEVLFLQNPCIHLYHYKEAMIMIQDKLKI